MRCHEARQRLTQLQQGAHDFAEDQALLEHLEQCPACAELARAEVALGRDFRTMAVDDTAGGVPWSILKTRVEAEAAGSHRKEISVMSEFANSMKKRPRLSVTLGVAAVILLVAALVPFKFEKTMGYEVAFAGVDRDLAMDNEKIDLLLKTLGCDGAVADVSDCEATCNLKISKLDSEADVQALQAAFTEIGNCVLVGVDEVCGEASTTMLGRAKADMFNDQMSFRFHVRPAVHIKEDEAISREVVQKLKTLSEDSTQPFSIFITGCGPGDGTPVEFTVAGGCDSNQITCDSLLLKQCAPGCAPGAAGGRMIRIDETTDGAKQAVLIDENGERHIFDLNNPDDIERMNQFDLQLDMFHGCQGGRKTVCIPSVEMKLKGDENGDSAAKESAEPELPEGYSLSQNYPNPFNSSTNIRYNLPSAQRVNLDIYNINGQMVASLVEGVQSAGEHVVEWNGTDFAGNGVATGVYIYRLNAGEFSQSKKMSFVK